MLRSEHVLISQFDGLNISMEVIAPDNEVRGIVQIGQTKN